ncbi:ABC transporter substrate-binding protein [Faecalicatena orotica]|uniref:Monosaccharide ABC transporter substrate-binding protein (CUT2 family) n=1 Tax=Faecalicatena orotica TaxID=1544 RepID=A0A2Y9C612_9FIRM|nr:substrate-binding domain-containing protein [Faecalicatena orotica]PWJ27776.1 monosaccharide ABC transporter substrate-binding protein (CUT2 family) [Faecalicatena orotica]SSA57307.1 monosaccharide ABC transporter substrate-binding protein, CUT2 family [Faecalicatena orotica]
MKKKVLSVLLAAAMVFSMAGCSSSSEEKDADTADKGKTEAEENGDKSDSGKIKIGYSPYTMTNEYFSAILDGLQSKCDELGMELIYYDPQNDPTTQSKQIDDMISMGIEALVYIPYDFSGARNVCQTLQDAGVYVVNADAVVSEDDYDVVDAIVASDNEGLGQLSGEWVAENYPDGANVLIAHLQTAEACVLNVKGFWDGIKEKASDPSKYKEVQVVEGGGASDVTFDAVTDALQAHDDIDVIYCINDTSAQGAIQAVEEAGKSDKIAVLGKDAAPIGKQAIKDGKQVQSSGQSPLSVGSISGERCYELINGKKADKDFDFFTKIDAFSVTQDNIDEYDIDNWS